MAGIPTFHRQAYGLKIAADVSIPELAILPPSSHPNTVRVSLGRRFLHTRFTPRWYLRSRLPGGKTWLRSGKTEDGYVLSFANLADFIVDRPGRHIVCCNAGDTTIETIRHLLIDQVLPRIVNLRGREAIHATAVATPQGICAFAGPAGAGKSTLAASFVLAGYPLVCDDCLAVTERKTTIIAIPGYPGLRLWDDSIRNVGSTSWGSTPVAQYTGKSRWSTYSRPTDFCSKPRRLARVYLLGRASANRGFTRVQIEELAPGEALIELVKTAYRFDLTDASMLKRQFHFLARLAARVLVKRLVMADDFAALADVREAVLRDLSERPSR